MYVLYTTHHIQPANIVISDNMYQTDRLCDELDEKIWCTEIIDWTVEKSLNFFLVQVYCQNMTEACNVGTETEQENQWRGTHT